MKPRSFGSEGSDVPAAEQGYLGLHRPYPDYKPMGLPSVSAAMNPPEPIEMDT